jgi:hypothetical protein
MLRVFSNFACASPLSVSSPTLLVPQVLQHHSSNLVANLLDADTIVIDAPPHEDIESQTAGHFCTVISSAIADPLVSRIADDGSSSSGSGTPARECAEA